MLVVEVKSHDRVEVGDDGLWRLGGDAPTDRSPYDQSADNRYSIRDWILRKAYAQRFPIVSAVWFPRRGGELVEQLEARIDVPREATLTRPDLRADRLATRVVKVLRAQERALREHGMRYAEGAPTHADIDEALAVLTPPVTWERASEDRRAARTADLTAATERQEQALQYFGANPRLLVTGPAGTGKTNVAVRAAMLAANRDERVLLACFNMRLEADLAQRLRGHDGIQVARAHELMLAPRGLDVPADADDAWWNGTLPAAALAVTGRPGFEPPFTCLVADEAQDLGGDTTLEVLDSVLVGGLAGAKVVLAGDFAHQDIFRPRELGLLPAHDAIAGWRHRP